MFGMTKKQFLKKSKICLKDTGIELLSIREIFSKEMNGKLNGEEAFQKLEIVRKNMENIFFKFEALNPPSKCKPLHQEIIHTIIILQDSVVIYAEYLILIGEGSEEKAFEKQKKSLNELERFREQFRILSREVDKYLN